MHFLLYEPDQAVAHLLAFVARRRGHKALALDTLNDVPDPLPFTPAAVIAGIESLDEPSIAAIQPLRQRFPNALLFLTPEEIDGGSAITALNTGATDVIQKPFHPLEVILRAELAVANRGGPATGSEQIARVGDLEVDLDGYMATKNGHTLSLTKLELRLLYCLASNHRQVCTIERLLSFGWQSDEVPDSTLKTHISHLRKKLSHAGGQPVTIRSRHMLGYLLELPEAS